jgi:hypothetical protein
VDNEIHIYNGPRATGSVRPGLAHFMRGYQRFGFTPGPLLAIGLLLGLAAALGLGRAARSGLRTPAFLFTALALLIYGASVAVNQFTWRYQLPLNIFIPAAAALALTALVPQFSHKRQIGSEACGS